MQQKIAELKVEVVKQVEQILIQKELGRFQRTGLEIDRWTDMATVIVFQNASEKCQIM